MRELSFLEFLIKYLKELSYCGSLSIYNLAREAQEKNPRLYEPLFLYALFSDKIQILLSATKNDSITVDYNMFAVKYDMNRMLISLKDQSTDLPIEYHKVYNSYLVQKNKIESDNHTKEMMRNRILKLKEQKKISNYRIYKDLNLNPGNMNSFLKTGNTKKISLNIARKMIKYLESF